MLTRLRLERLRQGLRQIDVVAMCQGRVPQHRLSLFERGLPPQPGEARVLADVFGIDPELLFPEFFRLANSQEKLPLAKEA
jgi:transcriptional regulator with XRE-family HTH domain